MCLFSKSKLERELESERKKNRELTSNAAYWEESYAKLYREYTSLHIDYAALRGEPCEHREITDFCINCKHSIGSPDACKSPDGTYFGIQCDLDCKCKDFERE